MRPRVLHLTASLRPIRTTTESYRATKRVIISSSLPTKEDLANNNKLFIELASKYLHWDEPADPIHIVGPLYFVGTRGLSSWLFVTSEGNILLNTGTELRRKQTTPQPGSGEKPPMKNAVP